MAKKKESKSGLMSSAGLMRYYDVEKTAIAISPKAVFIMGILVAAIVIMLSAYYGMWP
ncbi:MAG: preprotein translocase subunit Sec61beta [Methanocellales archaeon]|nr:preprotein translocase subunit Sec61beta [Methanocellales archaeon]MDD3292212.1 preprotein translocase subunit Sec61beta [Methanocellales archaeon]MDD5236039.1 preprotein translocase subunit Sec61beta [Methanocellales archaeon]MDD5485786.1 preprotein translocase subunit Sec61beta [Methanocellales archaeon]